MKDRYGVRILLVVARDISDMFARADSKTLKQTDGMYHVRFVGG